MFFFGVGAKEGVVVLEVTKPTEKLIWMKMPKRMRGSTDRRKVRN
jgi:hypothetical protein